MRRSITTPRRSPPNRPGTLPTMRRHENEPFVVNREVRAVVVPAGQDVTQNEDGTRAVDVKITLTAPGCGMGDILVEDVRDKIQRIPTVREARVELTFDPPWNQTMMSEAARLQTGMF